MMVSVATIPVSEYPKLLQMFFAEKNKAVVQERTTDNPMEVLKQQLPELYPRIYRAIATITYGSGLNAEDLTQDAFLRAFKNISDFNNHSSIYTWMHRIARNIALDAMRRLKIRRRIGLAYPTADSMDKMTDDTFPASDDYQEATLLLRRAISRLPNDKKVLITFKDLQELTYAEIGEILNIPEGTVKSRLFKARIMLKDELMELGYEHEH